MISLIFSTTDHLLSKIIRWIFREPCSHFAVCLDNRLVIQSSLLGVVLMWRSDFDKSNRIIIEHKMDLSLEDQERIYRGIISVSTSSAYDYAAFAYFGFVALRWRLFGTPMPETNKWDKSQKYLCTEIAGALPLKGLSEIDLSLVTPYKLYKQLRKYNFELN